MKQKEITAGIQFSHLEVLRRGPSGKDRSPRWYCRCVCGEQTLVRASNLRSGHTRSCGCQGRRSRVVRDKTYNAWSAMRQRCTNPNSPTWKNYGGRGIAVSPLWEDFQRFLHDVGPAPSPKHSLDRIDPDGDYEPGNVRWATPEEQARNRRSTRMLTFKGEAKPLSVWADQFQIPRGTLLWRVNRGWNVEQALTKPVSRRGRRRVQRDRLDAIRRAEDRVASARRALQEAEEELKALTATK